MTRDPALETMLRAWLGDRSGVVEKGMFGGRAFMLDGNLLCCARDDGLLVRLGKGNDAWALALEGVEPLFSGQRPMAGWVRAAPAVHGDAALRQRLLDAALSFVQSLPAK